MLGDGGVVSSGPQPFVVDADLAAAFAAATLDENPRYARTKTAPPMFAVVAAWPATLGLLAAVVGSSDLAASLHLRQDMRFGRPLRVGEQVRSVADLHGVRGSRFGTTLSYRVVMRDERDDEIVQVYATVLLRTLVDKLDVGEEPPDVTPPAAQESRSLGQRTLDVPADLTYRFGEATGDKLPVHVSDGAARRAGFPGVILHGMCTLAMCAAVVGELACAGDMSRLARLVVTFAKPLYPGQPLTISVSEDQSSTSPRRFGFAARQGGRAGTRGGFAEVVS
jgi:acyl dehydratase